MNKILNLFYPIVKVQRSEQKKNYEYCIEGNIVIVLEDGAEKSRELVKNFLIKAEKLLDKIKKSKGTFADPDIETFMNSVHCHSLKAKSKDKTDIRIVIHDLRTNMQPSLGFSIKSQLGSNSTLLNASQITNFTYSIEGNEGKLSDTVIEEINNISTPSKIQDRIKDIMKNDCQLVFKEIGNSTFRNNLKLVDSFLPKILAEMILDYFSTKRKGIKEITEEIAKNNPLGYDVSDGHKFYEHKMKCFLADVALGMMPAVVWTGEYEANGGYLVVKEDGDVLCYHFYDRNLFVNYLYNNTRFETADSTRNKFGIIEKQEDGSLIFKLNLQIRFK